jgi:hypothetical protein
MERLAQMFNTNVQRLSTNITKVLLSEKGKSTIWFCIFRWRYIATIVTYLDIWEFWLYTVHLHVTWLVQSLTICLCMHRKTWGIKCILQRNALLLITVYCRRPHIANIITSSEVLRGSFQNFCTLYIFSLKMYLLYKIHLQAFNVIFIVLYHSGPTFGRVLYSHQTLTCSQNWRNHSVGNASEALRRCLMRWLE